jgi:hypothetical protein
MCVRRQLNGKPVSRLNPQIVHFLSLGRVICASNWAAYRVRTRSDLANVGFGTSGRLWARAALGYLILSLSTVARATKLSR